MENLHVKIESINGNELIIREGAAVPIELPKGFSMAGTIDAPAEYWEKKSANHEILDSVVIVDDKKSTIQLIANQSFESKKVSVTGSLLISEDLNAFKINYTDTFNRDQLLKLLKFSRIYFAGKDNADILFKLEKLKLKIDQEFTNEKSNRGDVIQQNIRRISSEIPTSFVLEMPVFVGLDPFKFKVDICFDVRDTNVSFWLESVELKEIIQGFKAKVLKDQVSRFPKGLLIIYC